MSEGAHVPVLLREVVRGLDLRPGDRVIDGTVGDGGHALAILEHTSPDGSLLGLDADSKAIAVARRALERFGARAVLVHSNFVHMERVAAAHGFQTVDGILLDLGMSSRQLADEARGFSFRRGDPLDMRFDMSEGIPAATLVNTASEAELATLVNELGEEPRARAIARGIARARQTKPIQTAAELTAVVERAVGPVRPGRTHPATRTFQALRIAVNRELENLRTTLPSAVSLLAPGGRLAIISFHSLEDRIVKRYYQRESRDCVCPPRTPACVCGHTATLRLIRPQPITPSQGEIEANPRARSARLRIAEKIARAA